MILKCDGEIFYNGGDATLVDSYGCTVAWTISPGVSDFDPATDLDPVLFAGAVGAGFFALVPLWFAAVGARALIRAIR